VKYTPSGDVAYGEWWGAFPGSTVNGIAVDSSGNAYFGYGAAAPLDAPTFCGQGGGSYITVASSDGLSVLASAYVTSYPVQSIAVDGRGGVYAAFKDGAVARFDLTVPSGLNLICAGNAARATYVDPTRPFGIAGQSLPLIAPGEIVTLAGKGFTASTSLTFDGYPAPILYADSSQINAVVPFEIGGPEVQLTLDDGEAVLSWPVLVQPAVPAIFADAIVNEDGMVNSSANPAQPGSTMAFYLSGAGLMTPPVGDGELGPSQQPYPTPSLALFAALRSPSAAGIMEVPILLASQSPGLIAGLVSVRIQIPQTTPSGMNYLSVYAGDYPSALNYQGVPIYIQ